MTALTQFAPGANVGLFAFACLRRAKSCGSAIRVHCFEPIPATFAALTSNIALLGCDSEMTAHNVGISNREGQCTFQWHPHAPALSTMYDAAENPSLSPSEVAQKIKEGALSADGAVPLWLKLTPSWLLRLAVSRATKKMAVAVPVECQLRTLSSIIKAASIVTIDLLKVDVEQAECVATLQSLIPCSASDHPQAGRPHGHHS